MMKRNHAKLLILLLLFNALACDKFSECEGIICFTPPPGFYIEIIDKESDTNLYSSNTLNANDITFEGADNEDVDAYFINENGINLIDVSGIGWIMGLHTYTLILSDNLTIRITIEMEERNSDCCTFYEVLQFDIEEYEFERSVYSEIIKVKI